MASHAATDPRTHPSAKLSPGGQPARAAIVHLVVGPEHHGVVFHSLQIAALCRQRVIRQPVLDLAGLALDEGDVLHVGFTDRLFALTAEDSAEHFARLADHVQAAGASLSVTLHDVPSGDNPLQDRRTRCYESVVARCRGVVVCSWSELSQVQRWPTQAASLRKISLPIAPVDTAAPLPSGTDVGVLGFVYPDRGYEKILRELPTGSGLRALGTTSAGHEHLPAKFAAMADRAGQVWRYTGYLNDDELRHELTTVAVPVAPNQRGSASGSINSWLMHGRRPLVARSAYAEEFQHDHPGLIVLYDPDDVGRLSELITERLHDPALTVLGADDPLPSNIGEVASEYRSHLNACLAPKAIEVDGRYVVPENRWDLLPRSSGAAVDVSVVVPYFNQQHQLDLVLTALAQQTHPASRLQVIVADDGSAVPPRIGATELPIKVVSQPDRGFRAAAARNLGASVADGQVLVFLDADTVPEAGYIERLVQLPAVGHDLLVVGRRRHADLSRITPESLAEWLRGEGSPPPELAAPEWLAEGYRSTGNLSRVDGRSYRLIISAVMGIDRDLFDEVGGFAADLTSYGGEDWEFAHRAYQAGAVLAHVPEAVAWHDGADWAGREVADRRAAKNVETQMLASRVPDASLRDGQWWPGRPAVVITMPATDELAVFASARSAFVSQPDSAVWLQGRSAAELAGRLHDPRITAGTPPADVLASCRVVAEFSHPGDLAGLRELADIAEQLGEVRTPIGRLRSSRSIARTRRWAGRMDIDETGTALFGRRDRADLTPWADELDLGQLLSRLRQSFSR